MNFSFILLQAGIGEILSGTWPLILIIVVFYFFIIRPQQKKQKEQANFLNSLEKGIEVVTTSGIIGRINKIENDIVTLQVDAKTFIRITKSSVSKELTETVSEPQKDAV
jgi:preprotein translocase subunit YajC